VVIYDDVPAGIGFSQKLYELHGELMQRALELVQECECEDGCLPVWGQAGRTALGKARGACDFEGTGERVIPPPNSLKYQNVCS